MLKNKIIKVISLLLLILVIHQIYWYNFFGGNLVIYTTNLSSEKKATINLHLDDEIFFDDIFTNSIYSLKTTTMNVSLGKHKIVLEAKNEKIKEEYYFHAFLIKRVIIEYQGKHNQLDGGKEFLVYSENVFGNFVIE